MADEARGIAERQSGEREGHGEHGEGRREDGRPDGQVQERRSEERADDMEALPGEEEVQAGAACARLDARLPAERRAAARTAHVMAVRPRADVFPDDADLVDRAVAGRRRARRLRRGAIRLSDSGGAAARYRMCVCGLRLAALSRRPLVRGADQ